MRTIRSSNCGYSEGEDLQEDQGCSVYINYDRWRHRRFDKGMRNNLRKDPKRRETKEYFDWPHRSETRTCSRYVLIQIMFRSLTYLAVFSVNICSINNHFRCHKGLFTRDAFVAPANASMERREGMQGEGMRGAQRPEEDLL